MKERKREAGAVLILAATAFLMTALCSMSSPLYPTNIWDDANCLLTVGRAMRAGRVLYRDIYEQKGPLLYLAHMLAACVSGRSFFGVYLMESLCVFGFLAAVRRLLCGRAPRAALAGAVLTGACVLVGRAFVRGDSAEEFCLPFLMWALCLYDGAARKGAPLPRRVLFRIGLLAGLTATVKFTLLGVFLGLCLCEGAQALRAGGVRRAARSALDFLAGFLAPVLPWLLWFAAKGALPDAWEAYVYNNVFLYAGEGRWGLPEWAAFLRGNALWALPCAAGVTAFVLNGDEAPARRAGAAAAFSVQLLALLLPGRLWQYSLLALAPFAAYGALLAIRAGRALRIGAKAGAAAALAASLLLCAFATPNAFLRGVPYGETAQARLAAHIPEGSSVLQMKFLDDGLYLAADAIPQEKYFVLLNVQLPEMRAALEESVAAGRPDFVLTSYDPLPARFDRYRLIATEIGYLDSNLPRKELYLYRREEP